MIAPAYSAGVRILQLNLSPFLLLAVLSGDRSCTDNFVFGGTGNSGSSTAFAVSGRTNGTDRISPLSISRNVFISRASYEGMYLHLSKLNWMTWIVDTGWP